MIYYDVREILIRDMIQEDAQIITDEEIAQGWHQTIDKYKKRLQHQAEGKAVSLVAEYNRNVAGYINVYPNAKSGAFADKGYSEIVDFGVLEKYRRKGIGNKLMDIAEKIATTYSDMIYLGVGLHSGYGNAQRMYAKRGYIPDGSGVWYGEKLVYHILITVMMMIWFYTYSQKNEMNDLYCPSSVNFSLSGRLSDTQE